MLLPALICLWQLIFHRGKLGISIMPKPLPTKKRGSAWATNTRYRDRKVNRILRLPMADDLIARAQQRELATGIERRPVVWFLEENR